MRWWIILLSVLCGCDRLLPLSHAPPEMDSAVGVEAGPLDLKSDPTDGEPTDLPPPKLNWMWWDGYSPLYAVWGQTADTVHFGGGTDEAKLYAYTYPHAGEPDGTPTERTASEGQVIRSIHGSGKTVIAVGDGGTMLKFDTTTFDWSAVKSPKPSNDMTGVWVVSEQELWAVGVKPTLGGLVWHSAPVSLWLTLVPMHGIWAQPSGTAWAVGDGALVSPGAASSDAISIDVPYDLTAIWGGSSGESWITTTTGQVLRYTPGPGTKLQVVHRCGTQKLHAIWGSSLNDLWVVGDANAICHFDGQVWTTVAPPQVTGLDLHGVWCSTKEVWIVGQNKNNEGVILHGY